jgi:hypothetical protein
VLGFLWLLFFQWKQTELLITVNQVRELPTTKSFCSSIALCQFGKKHSILSLIAYLENSFYSNLSDVMKRRRGLKSPSSFCVYLLLAQDLQLHQAHMMFTALGKYSWSLFQENKGSVE